MRQEHSLHISGVNNRSNNKIEVLNVMSTWLILNSYNILFLIMTDIEDSDRYNPRESENDEIRIPSRVMLSIVHNQPHPVFIKF